MRRWLVALGLVGALMVTGASNAAVAASNGKLAFAELVGSENRLVIANADGTDQQVLAGLPTPVSQPRWSPDGRRLAFVAGNYASAEIYVVDSDGTDLTQLTSNSVPDKSPSWTLDGREVVYQHGTQVWLMSADGSTPHRLFAGTQPSVSPSELRIAYVRGGRLYVANAEGRARKQLTRGPSDTEPAWSPNGRSIVFVHRIGGRAADLWVIGSNGSGLRRLTRTSDRSESDPAWSPQGDQIAFRGCTLDSPPACDLFTMAANGVGIRPLSSAALDAPLIDGFEGTSIDRTMWNPWTNGGGVAEQANGRLELSLPANPIADAYGNAGAGVTSICPLHGDFDVQVDYSLLEWPGGVNGANVGFNLYPVAAGFNRTSASWGPSVYNMWADPSGGGGATSTTDTVGTMRFVRTGTLFRSYVLAAGSWQLIASADGSSADTSLMLVLGAHLPDFAHQQVKVALDNFRVNAGRFVCAVDGHWPNWRPARRQELTDDFAAPHIDDTRWSPFVSGTGPEVAQSQGDLEVTIPAASEDDPAQQTFGAGVKSRCTLAGDFDLRVNYSLLGWPPRNGVRVGLIADGAAMTERTSNIDGVDNTYVLGIGSASYWTTPTTDRTGGLRIDRAGTTVTSYVLEDGEWVAIAEAQTTQAPVGVTLETWGHDALFGHQAVRVAFTDFRASADSIAC